MQKSIIDKDKRIRSGYNSDTIMLFCKIYDADFDNKHIGVNFIALVSR